MLRALVKPESIIRKQRRLSCFWGLLPIGRSALLTKYATCGLSYADYRRAHTDNALRDKMMLRHCHKPSGFSLLELMMAIAIFSIIATLSAPSFQSWSR